MKGWRWLVSILIGSVIYFGLHYSNETVRQVIMRVVYSTNDLQYVGQLFSNKQPEMIMTSGHPLSAFTAVKRYGEGFIVHYEEPVTLTARRAGVIVFTGHMTTMKKVISIAYEDGLTATFGWLDDFYHLPYSAVRRGEVIGLKQIGEMYVEIEQHGRVFTLEETIDWLRYD